MSSCTIFKMHDVHSVCFVNTDLRSLTITCIIYTCYKYLACESKMASILDLIVGSLVGCPLNCSLFPYLKVVGYPLSCPLSCLLYPYMALVGSLICMEKFPWAAHGQPTPLLTELPTFSCLEGSGLPTELPTVSIHGRSGQPNLYDKIPMGSPLSCPLTCPLFSYLKVVGCLLSCPLSCPLFPYMEEVGSLICMAKFPWAAHGQPTPLSMCSPWVAKWAAPLFFPYGNRWNRLYRKRLEHAYAYERSEFLLLNFLSYFLQNVYSII